MILYLYIEIKMNKSALSSINFRYLRFYILLFEISIIIILLLLKNNVYSNNIN